MAEVRKFWEDLVPMSALADQNTKYELFRASDPTLLQKFVD